MLDISLENLENMRVLFRNQEVLAENTGSRKNGTMMLDQDEFTDLCRRRDLKVLVDVGHAHVNGREPVWEDVRQMKRYRNAYCKGQQKEQQEKQEKEQEAGHAG